MITKYSKYSNIVCPYDVRTPCNFLGTAAAIAGVASLVGGALQAKEQSKANATNLSIARENNKFNEQMMREQMAYNTEMWNKQNAYNDPLAQVERYKNAGLNPYLMMSQGGNAGAASGAMGINPPTAQPVTIQPQTALGEGLSNAGLNMSNMMLQNESIQADVRQKDANTQLMRIDSLTRLLRNVEEIKGMKSNRYNTDIDSMIKDFTYNIQKDTRNEQILGARQQVELQRAYITSELQRNISLSLDNELKEVQLQFLPQEKKTQIANTIAQTVLAYKTGELTKNQAEHVIKQKLETEARTVGIRLDNHKSASLSKSFIKHSAYMMELEELKIGTEILNNYYNTYKSSTPTELLTKFVTMANQGMKTDGDLNGSIFKGERKYSVKGNK